MRKVQEAQQQPNAKEVIRTFQVQPVRREQEVYQNCRPNADGFNPDSTILFPRASTRQSKQEIRGKIS